MTPPWFRPRGMVSATSSLAAPARFQPPNPPIAPPRFRSIGMVLLTSFLVALPRFRPPIAVPPTSSLVAPPRLRTPGIALTTSPPAPPPRCKPPGLSRPTNSLVASLFAVATAGGSPTHEFARDTSAVGIAGDGPTHELACSTKHGAPRTPRFPPPGTVPSTFRSSHLHDFGRREWSHPRVRLWRNTRGTSAISATSVGATHESARGTILVAPSWFRPSVTAHPRGCSWHHRDVERLERP